MADDDTMPDSGSDATEAAPVAGEPTQVTPSADAAPDVAPNGGTPPPPSVKKTAPRGLAIFLAIVAILAIAFGAWAYLQYTDQKDQVSSLEDDKDTLADRIKDLESEKSDLESENENLEGDRSEAEQANEALTDLAQEVADVAVQLKDCVDATDALIAGVVANDPGLTQLADTAASVCDDAELAYDALAESIDQAADDNPDSSSSNDEERNGSGNNA
jgi:hypothetical protein